MASKDDYRVSMRAMGRGSINQNGYAMTWQDTGRRERACAAVVLYRPDVDILAQQAEGLRDVPVFVFLNGPVSTEAIAALAPMQHCLIESQTNVGLGRGLNAVMDAASRHGFSHVMLLDQDSEPSTGLIDILLNRAVMLEQQGEKVAVLAPLLTPPQEGFYKPIRYEWRGASRLDGLAPVEFAPTSGSLISMRAYADIGPFRDDFFIAGLDVEWGFRAWSLGWASFVATDLAIPHRWGEAVSQAEIGRPQILRQTPVRNYYYARSVIAVAKLRHVPTRWRLKSCAGLAAQTALLALRGPRGSLRAVRSGLVDGFKGRLGPAPEGIN
jgi:rhamnosyltransferase